MEFPDETEDDEFVIPTEQQDSRESLRPEKIKLVHVARVRKYLPGAGRIGSPPCQPASEPLPAFRRGHHDKGPQGQPRQAAVRKGGPSADEPPRTEASSELTSVRRGLNPKQYARACKKIMSLPCTIVRNANGNLGILDLNRLHYVTHRLALGADGLKKLVELQQQLIGHSEFSDSSNLSVLQMPTLDFEAEYVDLRRVPLSKRMRGMDIKLRRRIEEFEERTEQYRTEKLAAVVPYVTLAQRAAQAAAASAAARSENLPPLGVRFERQQSNRKSTSHSLSFRLSVGESRHAPSLDSTLQQDEQDPSTMAEEDGLECETGTRQLRKQVVFREGSKWRVMQGSVQAMAEKWVEAEKSNRRLKGPMFRSKPSLMEAFNVNDVQALYNGLHDVSNAKSGISIYTAKCKELGVATLSKVMDELGKEYADMSHAGMSDRGMEAFSHCLPVNTCIRVLNVRDNRVTAVGVKHLLRGMMTRTGHIGGFEGLVIPDRHPPAAPPPSKHANPFKLFEPKAVAAPVLEEGAQGELEQTLRVTSSQAATLVEASPASHYKALSALKDEPQPDVVGMSKYRLKQIKTSAQVTARTKTKVDPDHNAPIDKLDLSVNAVCLSGAKHVAIMLNKTFIKNQFLVELVLDHCQIPDLGGHAIMEGLHGNAKLRSLCMRNNQLSTATAKALGEMLLQNVHIRKIDLSWNQIGPMGGLGIAAGLSHNYTLEVLKLAWNGLEDEGMIPIATALASNCGLKTLDVSSTRCGARSCVVVGELLRENSTLEDLLMNGNLIGQDGARHIMMGLNENKTLKSLGLQGSNTTKVLPDSSIAKMGFVEANPEGSYQLDLEDPSERIVAIQLCRIDQASEGDLMKNIRLSEAPVKSCKAAKWPDSLPTKGVLVCDFVRSKDAKVMPVLEAKKLESFETELREPAMSEIEKFELVSSFAPYSYLYSSQIARLISCFSVGDMTVSAAAMLFCRCVDLEDGLPRIMAALSDRDRHYFDLFMGWNALFRGTNPTGHYELNLSYMPHRMLAQRLKDQAMSEGDSLTWLNIMYEETTAIERWAESKGPPVAWGSFIPATGVLCFDYVEGTQLPVGTATISEADLLDVLAQEVGIAFASGKPVLPRLSEAWPHKVAALRRACCRFHVTAAQIKFVAQCFSASPDRVEAIVALWGRCVDRGNLWVAAYALSALEQSVLVHRLGATNVLHAQHYSIHWLLDTKCPSHFETMLFFVKEAQKDESMPNWWNIRLTGRAKAIPENTNMLGLLTTDSPTPVVSVDILMSDSFELLAGRKEEEVAALAPGDRLDLRLRLSQHIETRHIREFSSYFPGAITSPALTPAWATYDSIMEAVMSVPPWQAVWNRQMRKLVRLATRWGDLTGESPLEDLFLRCTEGAELMDRRSFDRWAKQSGYASHEVAWFLKQFNAAAAGNRAARGKGSSDDGITLEQFHEVFMTLPPSDLRKASAIATDVAVKKFIAKLRARVQARRLGEAPAKFQSSAGIP